MSEGSRGSDEDEVPGALAGGGSERGGSGGGGAAVCGGDPVGGGGTAADVVGLVGGVVVALDGEGAAVVGAPGASGAPVTGRGGPTTAAASGEGAATGGLLGTAASLGAGSLLGLVIVGSKHGSLESERDHRLTPTVALQRRAGQPRLRTLARMTILHPSMCLPRCSPSFRAVLVGACLLAMTTEVLPRRLAGASLAVAGGSWGVDQAEQPDRSDARRALLALGRAGTSIARTLARDPDPRVRREAALLLGGSRDPAVRAALLELALDPDRGVASTAAGTLAGDPERALAEIDVALAVPRMEPWRALELQLLAERLIPAWIESVFARAYTKAGNGCQWRGQFAPLVGRADACAVALQAIITSNENLAVDPRASDVHHFTTRLTACRALAEVASGLSESGRDHVATFLEGVLASPGNFNPRGRFNLEAIQSAARVALHYCGRSTPLLEYIERTRQWVRQYERQRDAALFVSRKRLDLAYSLHVIGRYQNAIGEYNTLLASDPKQSNLLYNLACSYALDGQVERAVDAVARAIDAGHEDHEQFLVDGELERARAHPSFAVRVLGHPKWKGPR